MSADALPPCPMCDGLGKLSKSVQRRLAVTRDPDAPAIPDSLPLEDGQRYIAKPRILVDQVAEAILKNGRITRDLPSPAEINQAGPRACAIIDHVCHVMQLDKNIEDNESADATDAAHPAWWRGSEYGCAMTCQLSHDILNGKDSGVGENNEPWGALRRRLLSLMRTNQEWQLTLKENAERLKAHAERIDELMAECVRLKARVNEAEKEREDSIDLEVMKRTVMLQAERDHARKLLRIVSQAPLTLRDGAGGQICGMERYNVNLSGSQLRDIGDAAHI